MARLISIYRLTFNTYNRNSRNCEGTGGRRMIERVATKLDPAIKRDRAIKLDRI